MQQADQKASVGANLGIRVDTLAFNARDRLRILRQLLRNFCLSGGTACYHVPVRTAAIQPKVWLRSAATENQLAWNTFSSQEIG
jgi:hypothetical protein|eukprot:COSAG03_NODE_7126_length_960_cov_0.749129_1_plen_84_part_00